MRQYQKYKPFQYDWLPVIPEHWDSKPLRKYFYISDERKGEQDTLELLSVYREYGVIPKASRNDNKNVESENTSKYKVVHTDDLVINKMKLWQQGIIVRDIENKESNHNYIPDDLSGYKLVEKGNFVINKI